MAAVAMPASATPASITQAGPGEWTLAGAWTGLGIGMAVDLDRQFAALAGDMPEGDLVVDGSNLQAIDSAGVYLLKQQLQVGAKPRQVTLRGWPAQSAKLMEVIAAQKEPPQPPVPQPSFLEQLGRHAVAAWEQGLGLCSFVGESSLCFAAAVAPNRLPIGRPARWRGRQILRAIQIDGFNALPIIGLTSFLLGIVVAYQGADQLRNYGASIFVVDLVGFSMLREFAPLITAIIVAGRSGSAYAAQIGTMAVTEEIDALHTLGIAPIDLLVLPKMLVLLVALPLLTVFADLTGVGGGMLMARMQLGISYTEFIDRFDLAIKLASFLIGVGKALVFAVIIVVIGCFQGFRTHGGADSVGRQTTRSVVQAIFLVIVADALFSVVFSILEL
jgi:phospholipid/cholesterol/gamma-HCH transport system permease protein